MSRPFTLWKLARGLGLAPFGDRLLTERGRRELGLRALVLVACTLFDFMCLLYLFVFLFGGRGTEGLVGAVAATAVFTTILFAVSRAGMVVDPDEPARLRLAAAALRVVIVFILATAAALAIDSAIFDEEIMARHRTEEAMQWAARALPDLDDAVARRSAANPRVDELAETRTKLAGLETQRDDAAARSAIAAARLTLAERSVGDARRAVAAREAALTQAKERLDAAAIADAQRAASSARATLRARERERDAAFTEAESARALASARADAAARLATDLQAARTASDGEGAEMRQLGAERLARLQRFAREILDSSDYVVRERTASGDAFVFELREPGLTARLRTLGALYAGHAPSHRGLAPDKQVLLEQHFPFLAADQSDDDLTTMRSLLHFVHVLALVPPILVLLLTFLASRELHTYQRLRAQAFAGDTEARQSLAADDATAHDDDLDDLLPSSWKAGER